MGLLGLAAIGSVAASPPELPPISNATWSRLEAGETVVDTGRAQDGTFMVTMSALYHEAPEVVWDVVADCSRFAEFMPRMLESEIVETAADSVVCRTVSDMPLGFSNLESAVRTWTEERPDGSYHRWFEQVPGEWSFARNDGYWSVWPHQGAGGVRTLLRYRLALAPNMKVPSFIVKAAQETTAPGSIEAIRREARRRTPTAVSAAPPRLTEKIEETSGP